MTKLFISYRRDSSKHAAGRLALEFYRHVRRADVYFDVEGRRGVNFIEQYKAQAAKADVVFALIGPEWNHERRLDSAENHVRQELMAAHDAGVSVLPILLDDTPMPQADTLPPVLRFVFNVPCAPLRHETFEDDALRLFRTAREIAEAKRSLPPMSELLRKKLDQALDSARLVQEARDLTGIPQRAKLVIEQALQSELSAIEAQYRARSAEEQAGAAVRRAKGGAIGTHNSEVRYANNAVGRSIGDGSMQNKSGYCEYEAPLESGGTVTFRGQFKNNRQNGYLVSVHSSATGEKTARFEGEMLEGKCTGFGVQFIGDDCRVGQFLDGQMEGPGVYVWNDGRRFEGEFQLGRRHGTGVMWAKDGSLLRVGKWSEGQEAE